MKSLKRNIRINNLFILLGLILIPVANPKIATGLDLYQASSVQISASIPDDYITLTGFSSSNAKIELESPTAYSQTYSDQSGFFKFDHVLLPKNANNLCLTSTDANLRKSTPLCLPPLAPSKYINIIGPVLLPPTITLDTAKVDAYSTAFISGECIPNSLVSIHLYQTKDNAHLIAKPVEAFSFPSLTTQCDQNSNYSFSIPTTYASDYRLYSSVNFQDNFSPKSNTLTYRLPSNYSSLTLLLIGLFFITFILFIALIFLFYHQPKPCQSEITTNH